MMLNSKTLSPSARSGFTLVELAIVLVIIGLIIGGVLVGQDMIKGAEVRATAGQFEKYSAAVNTFKDKYRQIPGDFTLAQAAQFGFIARTASTNATGQGDGNGMLEGCAANATIMGCETALVWEDLSTANLIDGSFSTAYSTTAPTVTGANIPNFLPVARMGRGNYITAYASSGYNYFQIGGISSFAVGVPTLAAAITPQEAFNIDSKLDDGKPLTGSTVGVRGTGTAFNDTSNANLTTDGCTDVTGAAANYKTTSAALAGTPACALRVRFN